MTGILLTYLFTITMCNCDIRWGNIVYILPQNLACHHQHRPFTYLCHMSSSSPPQPKNLLVNPFTCSKCFVLNAVAPPISPVYASLCTEQRQHVPCLSQNTFSSNLKNRSGFNFLIIVFLSVGTWNFIFR